MHVVRIVFKRVRSIPLICVHKCLYLYLFTQLITMEIIQNEKSFDFVSVFCSFFLLSIKLSDFPETNQFESTNFTLLIETKKT